MKDALTTLAVPRHVRIDNAPLPRVSPLLVAALDAVVERDYQEAIRRSRARRRAEVARTVARAEARRA